MDDQRSTTIISPPEIGTFALLDRLPNEIVLEVLKCLWESATLFPIEPEDHGKFEIELVKKTFLQDNTFMVREPDMTKPDIFNNSLLALLAPTPGLFENVRSLWLANSITTRCYDQCWRAAQIRNIDDLIAGLGANDPSMVALLLLACSKLQHINLPVLDTHWGLHGSGDYEDYEIFEEKAIAHSGIDRALFAHPSLKYVDLDFVGQMGLRMPERDHKDEGRQIWHLNCDWAPFFFRKMFRIMDVHIRFFSHGQEYFIAEQEGEKHFSVYDSDTEDD